MLQAREEWLAAYSHRQEKTDGLRSVTVSEMLAQHQTGCAGALHSMEGIGPRDACAVAKHFQSVGTLMQHLLSLPQSAACPPIATLKTSSTRRLSLTPSPLCCSLFGFVVAVCAGWLGVQGGCFVGQEQSAAPPCDLRSDEGLTDAGGKQVGQAAAKKLYSFFTCEDPSAPYP